MGLLLDYLLFDPNDNETEWIGSMATQCYFVTYSVLCLFLIVATVNRKLWLTLNCVVTQAQSFYILGLWIHDNSFQFVIFKPLSLVCKASSVASNQTRWYSKKKLRKSYLVPRNFSSIENYKLFRLYQKIHKLVNKSQLINLEKICSIVFFNNQLWYWHHKESASIFL